MKKGIIVVAVVVVLVVLGVVVFASPQSGNSNDSANTTNTSQTNSLGTQNRNTTNSAPAITSQNAVTITSSGFSPATLTVHKGDTVRWVNASGSQAYVAPDEHPTHQAYPGQWDDAGDGDIANGQEYSHTFTSTGTFLYHDHLRANRTGTIIVE